MTTNTDKLAAHMALVTKKLLSALVCHPSATRTLIGEALELLEAAGRVQQAEPVAWQSRFVGGQWAECSMEHARMVESEPGAWKGYEVRALAVAAPAERAPAPTVPTVCDGKEQEGFVSWAEGERMDMSEHPLHWLSLNEKTYAARQGWKAALSYVGKVLAAPTAQEASKPVQAEAASEDADPLTPEQEEWVMDLAEKHNLGRRIGQIAAMRGKYPDVFYTDASYRTHELFCFAAELLATQPPAIPAAPAVQASGDQQNPSFDDPRVQKVYQILCSDEHPEANEHWECFVARRIVAALASPPASGEKQA